MKIDFSEKCPSSENEPYMNPRQLDYFKKKLVRWRVELVRKTHETLIQLREERVREIGFLDMSTLESSWALRLSTQDRCQELIYEIDAALERIKERTYGYCTETGEEIGIKRLEANPIATLSLEAQRIQENRERASK